MVTRADARTLLPNLLGGNCENRTERFDRQRMSDSSQVIRPSLRSFHWNGIKIYTKIATSKKNKVITPLRLFSAIFVCILLNRTTFDNHCLRKSDAVPYRYKSFDYSMLRGHVRLTGHCDSAEPRVRVKSEIFPNHGRINRVLGKLSKIHRFCSSSSNLKLAVTRGYSRLCYSKSDITSRGTFDRYHIARLQRYRPPLLVETITRRDKHSRRSSQRKYSRRLSVLLPMRSSSRLGPAIRRGICAARKIGAFGERAIRVRFNDPI